MSQTLTDLDLDRILSNDTSDKSSAPWSRDEDDQLLRELYALMGDIPKDPKPVEKKAPEPPAAKPAEKAVPEPPVKAEKPKPAEPKPAPEPEKPKPVPEPEKPKPAPEPAPQPLTERTPEPAPLAEPEAPEFFAPTRARVEEEPDELPTERSAPGWLKGTFLFLISLLLCGMTLYAVAADVLGPLF